MNLQFKKDWIAALRSGEYPQTEGVLYDQKSGGFCCIGVACILAGRTPDELKYQGLINGDGTTYEEEINTEGIPKELIGEADKDTLIETLVYMNDGNEAKGIKKHSFEEIADWIEENIQED